MHNKAIAIAVITDARSQREQTCSSIRHDVKYNASIPIYSQVARTTNHGGNVHDQR